MRFQARSVLIAALVLAIGCGFWIIASRMLDARRYARSLQQARRDFQARRFAEAANQLERIAASWPDRGEVEYLLGRSEQAQGHFQKALEVWGRVPDRAPEAQLAALDRGGLALEHGRYAIAEASLEKAFQGGGRLAERARVPLRQVKWLTGQMNAVRGIVRQEVERSVNPSEALRLLWGLEGVDYPITGVRAELDKALEQAPDDDRVWLGLADLATRTGRFDEADTWLKRCEAARPEDQAVRLARLNWARAADRPDEVLRVSSRLPAALLSDAQRLELRAWLAAHGGDRAFEKTALEELIAHAPGDSAALERLTDIEAQAGAPDRVAELRRKKETIDRARDRYRTLMKEPSLTRHAPELARIAEVMGSNFEAKAWWQLAARTGSARAAETRAALQRLTPPRRSNTIDNRMLAEVVTPSLKEKPRAESSSPRSLCIPLFMDESESRGLRFTFDPGTTPLCNPPEALSGGVGVLDFDGDGRLDVYAVQGGPFPIRADARRPFGDRLFRGLANGAFEDATESAGLAAFPGGYGQGVAVGDYDNDGRPDLFITRWRSYALYHNLGNGCFEDATERAGLGGNRDWPTSAAWADLDQDGDLDLYVCHYGTWDPETSAPCKHPLHPDRSSYCDPRDLPALPDHLFRNDEGRFVDVSDESGITAADVDGRGLGVIAADLDDDGKVDLFVANDTTANYFFRNRGGFRFAEEGHAAGLATNAAGTYLAGMGIAAGDLDGDGRIDLAVTNFFNESTTIYHNQGGGLFSDRSAAAGMSTATRFVLGFGLVAFDANNDGRLDLAQANGHVNDYRPATPHAMPAQLFLGRDGLGFVDMSKQAGPPWQGDRLGRGLAAGDLDNDGRIDLVLVDQGAPLALLANRTKCPNHFVSLQLQGTASNRDAVGARVVVTAGGRRIVTQRMGGGSYLSASDPRIHIGLGPAAIVDRIEISWPSGRTDRFDSVGVDRGYAVLEGATELKRLASFETRASQP